MSDVPITYGTGQASVATERIGNRDYQIVKIVGAETGSTSTLGVNPDRSITVSVLGLQGASVSGTVQTDVRGSVAVAIIAGSIAATFTPPANQSVSGTVQTDVRGSVAVAIISGSIAATFTPPANQSVSGTVQVDVRASVATVIIGGSIATATTNSSVMLLNSANVIGSVTALQGTNPWTIVTPAGSVQGTRTDNASVITIFGQGPSIVGTYAEDAASSTGDKGIFALGVRNDTLASVSSADGDYTQFTVGPMGEVVTANAPITKWVYGTTSIVSGASVALIAAQGASIFTYVTGLNVVNPSANNFYGNISTGAGASSVLAYFVAPANGGSNMVFPNPLRSRDNTAILASISGVGSVYLSAQGFISKT